MGSGFSKKKKQAKQFQQQFMEMQEKMQKAEFTGTAGNGLVTIVMNGEHDVKKVTIKPEVVDPDDVEGLELLVTAAFKDASEKVQKESSGGMPGLEGLGDLGGLGGLGF